MPHPSEVHVDGALSTFISSYENGTYIADDISPVIETEKRSDKYVTYDRKDATTERSDRIGPSAQANEADYLQSTGNYSVEDRGLVGYVLNTTVANADDPQRPYEKRSRFLMNALMLGREIRVADLHQTTANYASTNTSAAGNVWSDATNGTPLADVDLMCAAIAPGLEEETELVLVLAKEAWQALRKHPDLQGGGHVSSVATLQEAADRLGVDRIVVSDAQKNTANLGQSASYSRIWSKTKAVLTRVPVGEPQDETGLLSCTFRHIDTGTGGTPVTVRTWDEPKRGKGGSQAIQVEFSDDEKVIQNDMGYCLTGILA